MAAMSDLSERYGRTNHRQRVVALVLIVVLGATSIGFVGWVALLQSTPQVQSRITYFAFPDDNTAVARLTVVRESESTIATCRLEAVSEDHMLVGETDITVTTGPTTQSVEVTIPTERRATTVTTDGCTTNEQSRPR
jgi:hypothetical protein